MVNPVPSVDKLTQFLSTVVISFLFKVRETLLLQAAVIQECSRCEASTVLSVDKLTQFLITGSHFFSHQIRETLPTSRFYLGVFSW